MKEIIKSHLGFLSKKIIFLKDKEKTKKVVKILNKRKLVLISGMKYSGKTKFILNLIKTTKNTENTFYFNKDIDTQNIIDSKKTLNNLLEDYKNNFGNPKLVVLQNINKISGIKEFISETYYNNDYKIIIIGNNIKIDGIKEVEISTPKINNILKYDDTKNKKIVEKILYFGSIEELLFIKNDYFKTLFLDSIKQNIIGYDIIYSYSIKNHNLFIQTITYLASINDFISLRELHREIEERNPSTSLATIIDYINFSLNAKIIKRIYKFDIKRSHTTTNNIKYYFSDVGVRNSLLCYTMNRHISIENLIFVELQKRGYRLKSGKNGTFEFSFIATKKNKDIYIHVTKEVEEIEIKKDAKKLLKIGDNNKKYLIVDKIKNYNLKKINLDGVKTIGLTSFLKGI